MSQPSTTSPKGQAGSARPPREEGGRGRYCQARAAGSVLGFPSYISQGVGCPVGPRLRSDWSRVLDGEVTLANPGCGNDRPADPEGLWLWNSTSLLGKTSVPERGRWHRVKSARLRRYIEVGHAHTLLLTHVHTPAPPHTCAHTHSYQLL